MNNEYLYVWIDTDRNDYEADALYWSCVDGGLC